MTSRCCRPARGAASAWSVVEMLRFLSLITDELDTQSESGWSVISELSESAKPLYSESYLKCLMSKDSAAILKSISQ